MYKIKSYHFLTLLLITICLFIGCKKELDEASKPAAGKIALGDTVKIGESVNLGDTAKLSGTGGQIVTIVGKNFLVNGQKPTVTLNTKQLTIQYASNDSLKVAIPKFIGSGKMSITADGKTYEGPEFVYEYNVTVTTVAGTGAVGTNDGDAGSATFNCPWGITADVNGDLYIADVYSRLIRKISAATGQVSSFSFGTADFYSPYNLTLDAQTHNLYVTDFNKHVAKVAPDGTVSVIYNDSNDLMPSTGIALGADGFLYVTVNNAGTMLRLTTDGKAVLNFVSGMITPRNIIFNQAGRMFVSGYDIAGASSCIYEINNMGQFSIIRHDHDFGGWEIAADAHGNFYEADHFHNVIRMIEPNGNVRTIAGNGVAADVDGHGLDASFNGPQGLTIDSNGNLYVTTYNYDTAGGNKVRKIVIQ